MGRKKKKQKKVSQPVKRGFSIWGILSCLFGSVYLTFFIYVLSLFHSTEMSFQNILYAFSIFPFGLVGFIMALYAIWNREVLGFAGLLFNLLGMITYSYIWYEIMTSPNVIQ